MALTAEGDNTSTNENNYEDNVMNVDDGENFTTYPDGCQSRMNSLEIVAANPADLPDQQPGIHKSIILCFVEIAWN